MPPLIRSEHLASLDEAHRRFREDPFQMVTWEGFLEPARASGLAEEMSLRSDLDPVYGLVPEDDEAWAETRGRHVSREEYERAREEERYFLFRTTRSWSYRPGQWRLDPACPFTLEELAQILDFVQAATGYALSRVRVWGQRFEPGDFVGDHHEDRLGRTLTAHLPVTPGWMPGGGSELRLYGHAGEERIVPPLFNSFVLFDVKGHWRQAILPTPGPAPVHRFLFWFYP
ncbi:hypothetical protein C3Y87_17430 [Carbonactinospora thermoautotrophica]|nr:hypothetical protein [Carbonactinospora thermoautotrophica]